MKLLPGTTLLAFLNATVLLGGGLVSYVVLSHKVAANAPLSQPGKAVLSSAPVSVSIEDDAILAKPIFRRSRQAIGFDDAALANSLESTADIPPPIPPSPVLVGVLRGEGGQNWVLLEGGGGASRRLLAKGGNFEGWRVIRIGAKEVTLHHEESKIDIQIRLPITGIHTSNNPD